MTDSLLAQDESPDVQAAMEEMNRARSDPRVIKLREAILSAIRSTMEMWCTDAMISDVSHRDLSVARQVVGADDAALWG